VEEEAMTEVQARVKDVEQARHRVLDAVAGVAPSQGVWKPASQEWSIAECVEHLCLVEQGGVSGLWKAIEGLRAGQPTWTGEPLHRGLSMEELLRRFAPPNPQAAEIARPRFNGPLVYWRTAFESLTSVLEQFARALEPLDLESVIHPHPLLGPLDARQRLDLLRLHMEIHREQIEAVKRAPGYSRA
jgi:hypothetical protein